MSAQLFEYTKISDLPAVSALTGTDVFVVNASGETSKISLTSLIAIITAGVSGDISSLSTRLTTAEGNITTLSGKVDTDESNIANLGNRVTSAENAITSVSGRVTTNESNITALGNIVASVEADVTDLNGTVNNIVTAGFNLIGIDTVPANNGEGE